MALYSCEDREKSLDPSFFGYEYYPVEIGQYWIYSVDSTVIKQQGANIVKSKTFVREEISSSYINAEGKEIFVIQRLTSDSLTGNYVLKDVWTTEVTEESAVRTEENLRFVKLVFPLDLDRTWKAHQFDNLVESIVGGETMWVYKDWGDYQIVSRGVDHLVGGTLYNNVAVIQQADHDFGIERRYAVEYYAPDAGLIEREVIAYDTQCACPGQTWEEKASSGFTIKQKLLEYN